MINHTDQVSRLEEELKRVRKQKDNLFVKNITLEEKNVRLVGEIKELKEKIKDLKENKCTRLFDGTISKFD